MLPYYSVATHPKMPKYVIKIATKRCSVSKILPGPLNDRHEMNLFSLYEGAFRFSMNERLQRIAREMKFPLQVPKEMVFPLEEKKVGEDFCFCVLSEKLPILSLAASVEVIRKISENEQRNLAKQMCQFIEKVGYADAHFGNFVFTQEKKLCLVDTESAGLFRCSGEERPWISIEKAARVGLGTLLHFSSKVFHLKCFAEEVDRAYRKSLRKYSYVKIVMSVLFPVVWVIVGAASLILRIELVYVKRKIEEEEMSVEKKVFEEDHLVSMSLSRKRYFRLIEGIPF
jgi:hypothetical protein